MIFCKVKIFPPLKGMSISFDDQIMRFANGEVRLMETEDGRMQRLREFDARKEARRDVSVATGILS
ncbi:hypothetical protein [Xenorhabdus santafensis]|uniref:hypothetical protein n=1 Tax=Xenorhabdus santafensis TaxID=2582833 RepID=UPI0029E81848|nr:hypothetical protein [Xenorhabdus sp. 12]